MFGFDLASFLFGFDLASFLFGVGAGIVVSAIINRQPARRRY